VDPGSGGIVTGSGGDGTVGVGGGTNRITITPPEPLTDDCYLPLSPGDSLDFEQLVAGSGTGTPRVSISAASGPEAVDLATITGSVVDFATEAETPGHHLLEFRVSDATGEDELITVVDYTSASRHPAGAALYSGVDAESGTLGAPIAGPIVMAAGETVSTFWDAIDGDQHCCLDATNQLHCGSCIYDGDAIELHNSWTSMFNTFVTNETCADCAAGELCVLRAGCMTEDPARSATCVATLAGSHYLIGIGCAHHIAHIGNAYRMTTGTAAPGTVAATMGRQLDVTAPPLHAQSPIASRCGFVSITYEVAVSPPYYEDPPCDGTSPSPSLCQQAYDAGNAEKFTAVYVVQRQ
jgi:hypothetical protein